MAVAASTAITTSALDLALSLRSAPEPLSSGAVLCRLLLTELGASLLGCYALFAVVTWAARRNLCSEVVETGALLGASAAVMASVWVSTFIELPRASLSPRSLLLAGSVLVSALWVIWPAQWLFARMTTRAQRVLAGFVTYAAPALALVLLGVVFRHAYPVREVVSVRGRPLGPPHVLLLSADALRPDFLSIYNSKALRTPHLDGLAEDAVVFEQARTVSPWTKPSLCTLHTGLPPATHRVTQRFDVLDDRFDTLAERFAAAGYRTGFIGSNHFLRPATNLDQGFVDYVAYPRAGYGRSLGAELATALALVPEPSPTTAELTDQARHWLREHASAPFFLWLHYFDPHMPYTPPARFLPAALKDQGRLRSFSDLRGVRTGHEQLDASMREQIRSLYAAEVQYVDAEVGRLLAELKALGLYDDMLIVFVSDHGEELWEHGGFEHGHTLYDELLRVPLFVKLPKSTRVGRATTRVSLAQVYPTLLEAARLPTLGPDRLPRARTLFEQESLGDRDVSFVAQSPMYYDDKVSVMRNGRKLIRSLVDDSELLFDLDNDPSERHPLSDETGALHRELDAALQEQQRAAERGTATLGVPARPAQDKLGSDPDALRGLRALGYVE